MRRKSLCRLLDVIGVLLLTVAVMSAASQDSASRKGTLSEILEFDKQQLVRFEEILGMEHSQAKLDRENFKTNAAALIESARRRRSMVDSHIEEMLHNEQKERFELYRHERGRQREMFMLSEGLLLTPEQQSRVRDILKKYRPDKKRMRPDGPSGRRMGMGRRGAGRMAPGGRGGDRFGQKLEQLEAKRAKEIKKILGPEQKELYKQVRHLQKAERKRRLQ